jgi:hypothetical protein
MATMTITIPDDVKAELEKYPWVNWSEVGREYFLEKIKKEDMLKKVKQIVTKSKLTEKDADMLSDKIKGGMQRRLKEKGLV